MDHHKHSDQDQSGWMHEQTQDEHDSFPPFVNPCNSKIRGRDEKRVKKA
jgi:hypothetical protein